LAKSIDASMKNVRTFCVIALLLVAGCGDETLVSFEKTLTHPAGFSVRLPHGFEERRLPTGFVFNEAGDLRSPRRIRLEFTEPPTSGRDLGEVKPLDSDVGDVRFGIHERGAGSGGTEYELTATLEHDGGALVLKAVEQSEYRVPAFATAWAVLETVRFP